MAPPEARVYYPPGQEDAMRAAIATVPGGKVLGTTEDKPLEVDQISAMRFNRFIQEMEPSLLVPKSSFQSAFSTIRPLPEERQRQIITSFLVDRVEGFPHAEEYARFLAEINSIPWFNLRKKPDPTSIQRLVDQHKERYGTKPVKARIVRNLKTAFEYYFIDKDFLSQKRAGQKKWDEITRQERRIDYEVQRLARDASASNIREAARKHIEQADLNLYKITTAAHAHDIANHNIVRTLLNAAYWTVDHPDKENPYQPLLDIFKLGGWPLGEIEGEFVVYFPKRIQTQTSQ